MEHTEIKAIIRENINAVCRNYIAIGYYLKQVQERQLYLDDGYASLGEYAQAEYGVDKTAASRLIQVVGRFCVEGNTPVLLPEYRDFSVSKLKEMLYLTEEQIEQVTVDTTVKEIRVLRRVEQEPEVIEPVATSQLEEAANLYEPEEPEVEQEPEEEFDITFGPEPEEYAPFRMDIPMDKPEPSQEPETVEGEYREVEPEEMAQPATERPHPVVQKRLYSKDDVKQAIEFCEKNFNLMDVEDVNSGFRFVANEFMKYDAFRLLLAKMEAEEGGGAGGCSRIPED